MKGVRRLRHYLARIADFIRESDKILLIICIFTSLYGCLAVFSATHYLENYRPVIIQLLCTVMGVVAAVIISAVDYEKFLKRWYIAAAVGVIPVILTFFIGFAPEGTDDKAWLDLGITTFQPSELLKICFIITFSAHLSKVKPNINKLKYIIPVAHSLALCTASTVIAANDLLFCSVTARLVITDTKACHIHTHVSRRIIGAGSPDTFHHRLQHGENFNITIVVDSADSVSFQMERINHVNVI